MSASRSILPDCIDELAQIRDELQVLWCALTNTTHADECVVPIGEHVHGLHWRLYQIIEKMKGTGA